MASSIITFMPDPIKKKMKDQGGLAESPIAEVFEGRHPSASEKQWAETTLAKTLEKSPEKPIGAASGINVDEHGNARFTTISNVPIRRLYTQADLPEDWNTDKYLGLPGQPPYTRRSEEHTSELQSHVNLVCRLLLEKKKKRKKW